MRAGVPASALALLGLLGACASPPAAGPEPAAEASAAVAAPAAASAAAAASAPAAASTRAPAAAPGGLPPHASLVRGAQRAAGLFTVWRKDDKVWFELRPSDFNRPFFLSPKLATGIGEARLFGGMMAPPQVVVFRRVQGQVQLLAQNTGFVARPGTPEARAVAAAYSPSLLAAAPVLSQPEPQHRGVLVDASALFVNDMLGLAGALQRTYRQNYVFDARNSAITQLRGKGGVMVLQVSSHYASANLAAPPTTAVAPGTPVPSVPRSVPDPRSLFFGIHYSLAPLPAQPMAARRADPRVGHFVQARSDFGDDLARTPRVRHIARWRLDKQDPAAELSEPVKPITFWLDRSVPLKYRQALTDGILEWNKAFERIGFANAIVVRQQPDNADFDTLDFGVASVRWMVNAQPSFGAIGPRHVDPRSGEILDADIAFESLSSRNVRSTHAQVLGEGAAAAWSRLLQPGAAAAGHDDRACDHAETAAEQLDYALDLLAARGEIDPDSPEAHQFVLDYLKEVAMHEVGHALGLRHNFRASTVYTDAQLSDPEFTRRHGLGGSVMEYAPINLPRPGAPRPAPYQGTLGPYDYWAIEYAYKPLPAGQEAAELARIAARSAEPGLAYGTDEDHALGIDPEVIQNDLGREPLLFARKRFEIAEDLLRRQARRVLPPDQDHAVLRRVLTFALRDVGRAAGTLLRQIGGVRTLRDFPNTGRDPLQPLPAAEQRAALDALARHLLAADSLVVPPALLRRLAPDFLERAEAAQLGGEPVPTDFPLAQGVHELRRAVLNQLMGDALAARVLDSQAKADHPGEAFGLAELYGRLEAAVWHELAGRGDIPAPRRELQREHVARLAAALLRPAPTARADARSLLRERAAVLATRIAQAARRTGLGEAARLHLRDSADTLRAALAAPLGRAAP